MDGSTDGWIDRSIDPSIHQSINQSVSDACIMYIRSVTERLQEGCEEISYCDVLHGFSTAYKCSTYLPT